MRRILINHLLEPPNRVTGITRFLFAMLNGLLNVSDDQYILATCWPREALPAPLKNSRLIVETCTFYRSNTINVMMQHLTLPAIARRHGIEIEFNSNPIGNFGVAWPRVMTVHDLYLNLLPEEYSRKAVLVGTNLMKRATRGAEGILVPSESTRRDLGQFYPDLAGRSFVVHEAPANFESLEAFSPATTSRYGLIVGNLSPNKNVGMLIDALVLLRAQGLTIPFLHIGRDENGLIAQHSARVQIENLITSRQGVSDAELAYHYKNAAFFAATSLHEGFCLPLIEAQACGTPVIASNCSALPEVAGDGALFVNPRSPADIANAMRRVWEDQSLAAELSQRALINAKRFSWEKAARALRGQLEDILARTRGAVTRDSQQAAKTVHIAETHSGKNHDCLSH